MLEQPSSENEDEYLMTITLSGEGEESVNALGSDKYPNQVFAQLEIEGKMVKFQLDLGATCNVIRYQDLPSGVRLQKTNQVLSVYNKDHIREMFGQYDEPQNPEEIKGQFVVVENKFASLLGAKTIQQMGLVKVCHELIMMTKCKGQSHAPIQWGILKAR